MYVVIEIQKKVILQFWFDKDISACILSGDPECSFNPGTKSPDLQVPFFCGSAPQCEVVGSQEALKAAIRNVETSYAVVGTQGLLEMTLKVLEQKLPRYVFCKFQCIAMVTIYF